MRRAVAFVARSRPRSLGAAVAAPRRWSGTAPSVPSAAGTLSAVNVEAFTLNEEVVAAHRAASERWQALDAELAAARAAAAAAASTGDAAAGEAVLAAVHKGLALLAEVGADNSPMQCGPALRLEEAQSLFNLRRFAESDAAVQAVLADLAAQPRRDDILFAAAREFRGFVLLELGRPAEAFTLFDELVKWIDTGVSRAMPMVAVAARNMRRTAQMGLGMALAGRGIADGDRALTAQGLDQLIESLTQHIELGDTTAVKSTLAAALKCFVALGDAKQAIATSEKYIHWCRRNGDETAAVAGETQLAELRTKYGTAPAASS